VETETQSKESDQQQPRGNLSSELLPIKLEEKFCLIIQAAK
jgi:hypothetical protein